MNLRRVVIFSVFVTFSLVGIGFFPATVHADDRQSCEGRGGTWEPSSGITGSDTNGICWANGQVPPSQQQLVNSLANSAPKSQSDCTSDQVFVPGSPNPQNSQQVARCDPKPKVPQIVECQKVDGEGSIYGAFRCGLAEFFISFMAAIISLLVTLLQWADAALNFAIQNTIVDFQTWFTKLQDPIVKAWTIFRDLSNILIIGLFVFIAISIILGLQEYGQKKLIARVIIVATLINFSFLFTTIVINTSNMLATAIVNTMPQNTGTAPDTVKGIGDQFVKYMGVTSAFDTRNMLFTVYNNPQSSLMGVITYSFFAGIFVVIATGVFLYGALLLFSRFIILAVILLPLSALAFGLAIVPSLQEGAWGRWWQSLLRNSFLAPIMMLFMLIALNLAIATNGATVAARGVSFADFINNPAKSSLWEFFFGYIIIIGALFGGMYIASKLATGAAGRLASVSAGSLIGAGAGVGGWAGRRVIGRAADIRASNKGDEAKELAKTIARKQALGDMSWKSDQAKLEKVLRQKAFATSLAKSTFDLRNTSAGGLLKKTGAASTLTEGTKKNYADTAHHEAMDAAKAAVAAAVGKDDAKKIAQEVHADDKTHLEAEHDNAQFDSRRSKEALDAARRASQADLERDKQEIEDAETRKKDISASLPGASAAERRNLLNEMGRQTQRITDAKARTRTTMANLQPLEDALRRSEDKLKDTKQSLRDFSKTVDATAEKIAKEQSEMVADVASRNVGGYLGRATGIRDAQVVHHAREIAGKRYKIKDKAEAREALKSYSAKDDHAAPSGGGGAAAGGAAGAAHH